MHKAHQVVTAYINLYFLKVSADNFRNAAVCVSMSRALQMFGEGTV